ncbi:hypothetical protein [Pseudarthrobacter sulfonivorans]|uniref:hypothetical protein n=1 Tax=Pseudarthrobacter sulfonivorans TaxID=121292 RepID=UPI002865502F|nr:hypothetical protein [Pseudarthrobacter sulfonivorans]MDR6414909.1 hypothetical protein [Pseudarthrobacter sulfonivorans]
MIDQTFSRIGKSGQCSDNALSIGRPQRAAAENYMGAQLSEVLNEKVTSSEEGGFSRRRVVKGVAWSLPVIATAIAAPAAATSGIIEVLWDFEADQSVILVRSTQETKPDMNRTGTGPKAFYLRNTTLADSAAIQGSVRVTPSGTGSALAGIYSFPTGSLTNQAVTGGVFSANFALASGVAKGSMVTFPMGFYYSGSRNIAAREFTVDLSFTSPTGLVILSSTTILKLL